MSRNRIGLRRWRLESSEGVTDWYENFGEPPQRGDRVFAFSKEWIVDHLEWYFTANDTRVDVKVILRTE